MFSIFPSFIVPSGFVWLTQHLFKARDGRRGVIRLMSAFIHRAGQHKSSRRHRLAFFRSVALVESEQNGHAALLAANAEIPPCVGFGPSRNIQRVSLPSEMRPASCLYMRNNGISVLIRTNARNRLCAILMFFAVPECAFDCAAWLCADDENGHDRHFFSTCSPPLDFTLSSGDSKFSIHKDSSWKYSTATRKTVQE